ncbi:hypothetical protein RUM44_013003 [Polyplax serrata]|uniref:rRNA biogenesis protein RRP36 n=1 Tax=Polyplax serrata TaxID=468196 RepID=A0ABR1BGM7_POLSC
MEFNVDKGDTNESERNAIRSELSSMSFEDLKKLKDKLGSKVYKEAMFGRKKSLPKTQFKRENKNRPREVSSKIKPSFNAKVKEKEIADPRFNRLCGTFNKNHFRNTYDFLTDIRKNELKQLKQMLETETNPKEVEKLKYLIQRMDNQEREEAKLNKKKEREAEEKMEHIKALESGKKPHFKTKYEKKVIDLVDKYASLKKTGKLEKYIDKKQKKEALKDKKRLRYFDVHIE